MIGACDESLGDTARADEEQWTAADLEIVQGSADPVYIGLHCGVEEDARAWGGQMRRQARGKPVAKGLPSLKDQSVEPLGCEMHAQIRLGHRRDGMAAHHRVAIDAVDRAVRPACKQIAEEAIPAKTGLAADDGRERGIKMAFERQDGSADAADGRRRIEGGADLVVDDARRQRRNGFREHVEPVRDPSGR